MKTIAAAALALALSTDAALAWGDDGHKVAALIAEHYLTTEAKAQVDSLLAADTDPLTQHDIASEATWADRRRDSNNRRDHYEDTKRWHFVDLEIEDLDIKTACYGRKPPPAGTPASIDDKMACVVDKVAQFAAELEAPAIDAEERLFALKFLLHLVGDMHQPLHASDNNDAGGNAIKVMVDGFSHLARTSFTDFGTSNSWRRSAGRLQRWRRCCWARSRPNKRRGGSRGRMMIGPWRRSISPSPMFTASRRFPRPRCSTSMPPMWPGARRTLRCS
jgi:hypothetical protein